MIFGGHNYCLFVARIVSFAPKRSESANNTTRDTNKQYVPTKIMLLINMNINIQGQIIYTQLIKYFITSSILRK
jgi:hypothetical protein